MKILLVLLLLASATFSAGNGYAEEESCSAGTCHPPLRGLKMMHKPVAEMKCLDCHKNTGNHPFGGKTTVALIEPQPNLCFMCHKPFPQKKVTHGPVKKGACTSCHDPHGAPSRYLIDTEGGQTRFCTKCHNPNLFNNKYVHPPVGEGKCLACHEPHQSGSPSLLRDDVPKLCLDCHGNVMKQMQGEGVKHPPVRDGKCLSCHDAHSSPARYLLRGKPEAFCVTCHKSIAKTLSAAVSRHAPIYKPESCLSCHSGHVAKAKALLPAVEKELCVGCHVKIGKTMEGRKMVHGPISKGKCTPCHDPHGSQGVKLLKGNYPQALYVPYDKDKNQYSACLKCHQKNMLKFADTSIYTKFRDGKNNLHYVHVSHKKKGRTCRLCHEPHAADNSHLLNSKGLDFGEWNVPIGFEKTPNGGKCSPGCHGTFSYDRSKGSRK